VTARRIVVLIDCDNTLLDNDAVEQDVSDHLAAEFGTEGQARYWKIFDQLTDKLGYADYLGALQHFRLGEARNTRLLLTASYLLYYPFAEKLYSGALAAIRHLRAWGPTVILSDGDVVYQPRKMQRSGLWQAVEGRVLVYIHKERMLDAVAEQYPARHYVMIDDKLRILSSVKKQWGDRVTTIFARQGHYALDPDIAAYPPADMTIEGIGDLVGLDVEDLPGVPAFRVLEESKHS
jgi:FMN phosphatase YigB (HAD superfamily)